MQQQSKCSYYLLLKCIVSTAGRDRTLLMKFEQADRL